MFPVIRDFLTHATANRLTPRAFPVAMILLLTVTSLANAQNAGQAVFSSLGVSDKTQAKLWHHDGSWWGAFNGLDRMGIYELVDSTQTWTEVDSICAPVTPIGKGGTNDVFWDGNSVYIARYDPVSADLYKFTYIDSTRRFFREPGFPISIPTGPLSESIAITKDSQGRLWSGVVVGLDVIVRYSTFADTAWADPDTLGQFLDEDDVCNIHAWDGKVGVMWSNQADDAYYFRWRDDSAPTGVGSWSPVETVLEGVGLVDDHISITHDVSGRLFVGLKSDLDRILVARRNLDGSWNANTDVLYGRTGTRPIVLIDEADSKVYCFYTIWPTGSHTGENWIEYRVADYNTLVFGIETIFIKKSGVSMNNFQATVQPLVPGSIVGICDDETSTAYWNGWGSISGVGGSGSVGPLPMPPGPPGIANGAIQTAPGTSLGAAAYTFDAGTGSTVADFSGNGHTGELGHLGPGDSAEPEWTSGITGGGLLFNGINDYVQVPDAPGLSFTGSFTVECWMKLTGEPDKMGLINKGGSTDRNYRLMIGKTGTVEFAFIGLDDEDYEVIYSPGILDTQWHHIAAVWDSLNGEQRLYVDGQLRATSVAPEPPRTSTNALLIGARQTSTIKDYLYGTMDQVRVSAGIDYTDNFGPPVTFSEDPVNYITLAWSPPTEAQGGVSGYNVSRRINGSVWERINGFALVTDTSYTDPTAFDGSVEYRTTAIDLLGQEGPPSTIYTMDFQAFTPLPPTLPLAWSANQQSGSGGGIAAGYTMDEGSGQIVADIAGNQLDGYLGTSPAPDAADPTWMPGITGSALEFDGQDDCVTIPDDPNLQFPGNFTLQAWFQAASLGENDMALFAKGPSSNRNFRLRLESDGAMELSFASLNDGTRRVTTSKDVITDNNWHHAAGVYDKDGGELRIYVDGILRASQSETRTPRTTNDDILIGVRASNSTLKNWFEGRIDQVSFSGSVLYDDDFVPPTQFSGVGGTSIVSLNWSLPQMGLVAGYNIYRQSDDAVLWKLNYGGPTLQTSFVDNAPHLGSNCYYVVAITPQGLEGAATATTCFTITADELSTDTPELAPAAGLNLRVAPNPFNPSTKVFFNLPGVSDVTISLFDVAGRRVHTWTLLQQQAGRHVLPLNLSAREPSAATGIYFLRVETRFETGLQRIVLIK